MSSMITEHGEQVLSELLNKPADTNKKIDNVKDLLARKDKLAHYIDIAIADLVADFVIDTGYRPDAINICGVNIARNYAYIRSIDRKLMTPTLERALKHYEFSETLVCNTNISIII